MEYVGDKKILADLHPYLGKSINIDALIPYLHKYELVTDRELEFLMNEHKPSAEKINKLVSWLPRKGRDALKNFVKCLEESDEGTGHRTVAEKITNLSYSARKYSFKLDHPIGKIKAVCT